MWDSNLSPKPYKVDKFVLNDFFQHKEKALQAHNK